MSTVSCLGWHHTAVGEALIENNVFGIDKALGLNKQCIIRKGDHFGWGWEYEGCDVTGFAYPEIIVGAKVRPYCASAAGLWWLLPSFVAWGAVLRLLLWRPRIVDVARRRCAGLPYLIEARLIV